MLHGRSNLNWIDIMIKAGRKQLQKFSRVMAIAFFVMGFMVFIRHKPEFLLLWVTGVLFLAIGMLRPEWLSLVYAIWMKLAFVLSWVNTRILLSIIFYFILTPVSMAMKLFRFDPLDRAINKHKGSYWIPRTQKAFTKSDYERLY
jgi:hypothetical protein